MRERNSVDPLNALRKFFNFLYVAYVLLSFSIWIPLILVVHLIAKLIPAESDRLRFIYRAHRVWIGTWELMTRIQMVVQHHDKIDPDQAYVFVANHNNLLDIPVVGSNIIHPWKSLVKSEILSFPFMGWIIGNISIPVNRGDTESRRKSLTTMIQELKQGTSVLIFPEGTRNRTPQPLKRFHAGAFRVAIAAQAPIMPIVLTGIREMQPVDTMEFHPGMLTMKFLDPISTEGYKEGEERLLMEKVYRVMEAEILAEDAFFQPQTGQMAQA